MKGLGYRETGVYDSSPFRLILLFRLPPKFFRVAFPIVSTVLTVCLSGHPTVPAPSENRLVHYSTDTISSHFRSHFLRPHPQSGFSARHGQSYSTPQSLPLPPLLVLGVLPVRLRVMCGLLSSALAARVFLGVTAVVCVAVAVVLG